MSGGARLLSPGATAAVVFGAHDWTEIGKGRAPSFLRSGKGVLGYLLDPDLGGLDPSLVLDLFDDPTSAGDQLARMRDTLDMLLRDRSAEERPVTDVLIYYVGHGDVDDHGQLSLLVRRSRAGMEGETGIKAPDLARVLRIAAPQQRRLIVLDCCFSEAAARAFIGMSTSLDQSVAAIAGKAMAESAPKRGSLLLCSSPAGEISIGPPAAKRTLFTGAMLDVLRDGLPDGPPSLSFHDVRDAAYQRMLESFGARAPRPGLHAVNQSEGDLSRVPAFRNPAWRLDETARVSPPPLAPPPGSSDTAAPAAESPERSGPMRRLGSLRRSKALAGAVVCACAAILAWFAVGGHFDDRRSGTRTPNSSADEASGSIGGKRADTVPHGSDPEGTRQSLGSGPVSLVTKNATPLLSGGSPSLIARSGTSAEASINLLLASNGGQLLGAPSDAWKYLLDANATVPSNLNCGVNVSDVIFGFRGDKPATFDRFEILVPSTSRGTPSKIELLAGDEGPLGRFTPVTTIAPANLLMPRTPYQPTQFGPVTARYVKFRVYPANFECLRGLRWTLLGAPG